MNLNSSAFSLTLSAHPSLPRYPLAFHTEQIQATCWERNIRLSYQIPRYQMLWSSHWEKQPKMPLRIWRKQCLSPCQQSCLENGAGPAGCKDTKLNMTLSYSSDSKFLLLYIRHPLRVAHKSVKQKVRTYMGTVPFSLCGHNEVIYGTCRKD